MEIFNDIWEPWMELMENGQAISVDEVYFELLSYFGDKHAEMEFLKKNRDSFQKPTNGECLTVSEIYKSKKFREGIKEISLRLGNPEADAFLVAKAKAVSGVVVTAESDHKPNSEKIPNICIAFGVPYMEINEFYRMLKNMYQKRNQLQNVKICFELGKSTIMDETG